MGKPIAGGVDPVPAHTILGRNALFAELCRVRRQGFAVDNCEHDANVRCVGVPVYNVKGELVAGLSTSGPVSAMTDDKLMRCADLLRGAAARMRERIYY